MHVYVRAVRRAVQSAVFFDFHRDVTRSPLRPLSPAPQSGPQSRTRTRSCTRRCTVPLAGGCAAAEWCHLTNEFLLTSRSPLKNLFVLKRQCAELPLQLFVFSSACATATCYLLSLALSPIRSSCSLISFHANLELKLTARRVLMFEQVAALTRASRQRRRCRGKAPSRGRLAVGQRRFSSAWTYDWIAAVKWPPSKG